MHPFAHTHKFSHTRTHREAPRCTPPTHTHMGVSQSTGPLKCVVSFCLPFSYPPKGVRHCEKPPNEPSIRQELVEEGESEPQVSRAMATLAMMVRGQGADMLLFLFLSVEDILFAAMFTPYSSRHMWGLRPLLNRHTRYYYTGVD